MQVFIVKGEREPDGSVRFTNRYREIDVRAPYSDDWAKYFNGADVRFSWAYINGTMLNVGNASVPANTHLGWE